MIPSTEKVDRTPDVIAVLLEGHADARRILDEALRLLGQDADTATVARVALAAQRLLTVVLPLHELDEEQLVFPAIRAFGPADVVSEALDGVVDEHIAVDGACERLALRWSHVVDSPAALGPLRSELVELTEKLARRLARDLRHEELVVFPLVRMYVPTAVQERMISVMLHRAVV